ncbi:hypothetical protein HDU91_006466 [Kappamyces sp. JEL0680]|nr:hypothetical protein HDU91_006466 [Kappamyces sp. JEL0680]
MKNCAGRGLFATITSNTCAIWSIKPEVLLSKVVRAPATLKQDGENVDIIWNPDGSRLIVLTSLGFIHFYDVVGTAGSLTQGNMLAFHFSSQHHHAMGPGEASGTLGTYLRFSLALEVDSGAQCGVGLPEEVLICTNNPPSILSLTWKGEVMRKGTALLSDMDFYLDRNAIAQIVASQDFKLFGFVTMDGKAYIASRNADDGSGASFSQWAGSCIYATSPEFPPATTIDFNPSFTLVAVGTLHSVQASLSYSLAITKPGKEAMPIKLSAVTCLAWSSDGYALGAAWGYGGLSVWSVYGCLLTSTVSEDTFVHASDGVVRDTEERFFTGVQDLFWAPGDYFLFVLPAPTVEREIVLEIYLLEFAKSSILTSLSNQHNTNVCIIASDRLLMYDGIQSDTSMVGLDPLNWQTVHIPAMYLASNWPIKYAAATTNGQFIAVSGTRGFAHYNFASERWKFFGNEQQEQGFQVSGMLWYRTLIIVSCQNLVSGGFELRVYSRETKLDDANMLHVEKFDFEISAMNLTDFHLLVYGKNCVMQSYLIYLVEGPKVVFQLRQAFSLQEFVGDDKDCVQGIARLRSPDQSSVEDLFGCPILLLKNGALYLIWKQHDGWLATLLADRVEHFWVANSKTLDSDFQTSIWVFDGQGAKILSKPSALLESPAAEHRKETVFNMVLDFYPFVVLLDQGVLVGIKQQLSLNRSLEISQFGTEIKTHLFVHLIIENFLTRGQTARALSFSRTYQNLGYFNHALEMMLHDALEHDSDKPADADGMLARLTLQTCFFPL